MDSQLTEQNPSPQLAPEKYCKEVVNVPYGKFQALNDVIMKKFALLQVEILSIQKAVRRPRTANLTLKGTKQAIYQAKLSMFQELMNVEEQVLQLTQEMCCFLQSPTGRNEMDQRLSGLRVHVIEISGHLSVIGTAENCYKAITVVEGMICQEAVEISLAKYKALQSKINERCQASHIRIISDCIKEQGTVRLIIEATQAVLDEFKKFISVEMMELEERLMELTPEMKQMIKDPTGKVEVEKKLSGLKAQVVEVNGQFVCVSMKGNGERAVTKIKDMFCQDVVICPLVKYKALEGKIKQHCTELNTRIVSIEEGDADQKACITLEATQNVINQVRLYVYDLLMHTEEQKQTPVMEYFLRHGYERHVEKMVSVVDMKDWLSIVGSPDKCLEAMSLIEASLSKESIQIKEHHREFMKTRIWNEALQELQNMGNIAIKEKLDNIELAGTAWTVREAKEALMKLLDKNSFQILTVEVENGVYRYIELYCQQQVESIRSR